MRQTLALLLAFWPALSLCQLETCFDEGGCVGAELYFDYSLDDLGLEDNPNSCLFHCQSLSEDDCAWWTYVPSLRECNIYRTNCTSVGTEDECPNCITGERVCEPVYKCSLSGQCQGILVGKETEVNSRDLCLDLCKTDPDAECEWFTYDEGRRECKLFTNCPQPPTQLCPDCVSGEKECPFDNTTPVPTTMGPSTTPGGPPVTTGEFNRIFVTAGRIVGEGLKSEVFDATGFSQDCAEPADFPLDVSGAFGGFIGGRPVICGGLIEGSSSNINDKCFEYDVTGSSSTGRGAWNEIVGLTFRVGEAVATQIDANTIWFTGGYSNNWSDETRVLVDDGNGNLAWDTSRTITLPRESGEHCMLDIGDGQYFFVGGTPYSTDAYIYDWAADAWTAQGELADMVQEKRGAYCGVVTDPADDSKKVYLAAGYFGGTSTSTFVYDVAADAWDSAGPAHPESQTSNGIYLQYADSFLTVNGDNTAGNSFSDGEFRWFDASKDLFVAQGYTTAYSHYFGVGMMVPEDYYTC